MKTIEMMKKEAKYKIKHEQQIEKIKTKLMPNEKIVHCLDDISFNGRYYLPEWCVTNMGRGYSLSHQKWLSPQAVGNNRDYWSFVGVDKQVKVHQLVLNYFRSASDDVAIELFGEEGVDCHHIFSIEIPEELKKQTRKNRQARIKHCMECNCKSNLVYQEKEIDHKDDRRVTNGKETIGECEGTEGWSDNLKDIRSMASNSGKRQGNNNGVYYEYSKDENGKLIKLQHILMKFKGSN